MPWIVLPIRCCWPLRGLMLVPIGPMERWFEFKGCFCPLFSCKFSRLEGCRPRLLYNPLFVIEGGYNILSLKSLPGKLDPKKSN